MQTGHLEVFRKMKKLCSLLLSSALCLSLCPAAAAAAAEGSTPFPDLSGQSDTVRASIAALADKQVFTGYDDGTFRPDSAITRGWMDICNRTSISRAEAVTPGRYNTYTLQLKPMDYTVKAGHQLALVLYSTDVEVTYWPATVTNFTVDNSGTSLTLPVR